MAAPSIEQVMTGIEARLATIPGLRTAPYVKDSVSVPFAVVGVPDIPEYRITFGKGRFRLTPTVTVLVSAALDRVGQLRLAAYANPDGVSSIAAAIEGDRTLGGVVEECYVSSFRVLGMEEVGAIGYYGGLFELEAVARGK